MADGTDSGPKGARALFPELVASSGSPELVASSGFRGGVGLRGLGLLGPPW